MEKVAPGNGSLNQKLKVDVVNLPVDKTISGHFCTENCFSPCCYPMFLCICHQQASASLNINKRCMPISEQVEHAFVF